MTQPTGADTFTYDAENRLTWSVTGVTTTYAYNGDGLRTSRTSGGVTANYVWDVAAGLPVVLQDSQGNSYVYGLDLISRGAPRRTTSRTVSARPVSSRMERAP